MSAYEFDGKSVFAAQKALYDAVIEMNNVVERPLRRVELPEMPASVKAHVRSGISDAIGGIGRARVSLASLAQDMKNKSYDLVEHDDPSQLGLGWRIGDAIIRRGSAVGRGAGDAWSSMLTQGGLGVVAVTNAAEQVVDRARRAPALLDAAQYAARELAEEAEEFGRRWRKVLNLKADEWVRGFSAQAAELSELAQRAADRAERLSAYVARTARSERFWGLIGRAGAWSARLPVIRTAVRGSRLPGVSRGLTVLDLGATGYSQYQNTPFDQGSGWTALNVVGGSATHAHPVVGLADTLTSGAMSHGTVEGTLVLAHGLATGDTAAADTWVEDRIEAGGAYGAVVGWGDAWASTQGDWGIFEGDGSVQWNPTKWNW